MDPTVIGDCGESGVAAGRAHANLWRGYSRWRVGCRIGAGRGLSSLGCSRAGERQNQTGGCFYFRRCPRRRGRSGIFEMAGNVRGGIGEISRHAILPTPKFCFRVSWNFIRTICWPRCICDRALEYEQAPPDEAWDAVEVFQEEIDPITADYADRSRDPLSVDRIRYPCKSA